MGPPWVSDNMLRVLKVCSELREYILTVATIMTTIMTASIATPHLHAWLENVGVFRREWRGSSRADTDISLRQNKTAICHLFVDIPLDFATHIRDITLGITYLLFSLE